MVEFREMFGNMSAAIERLSKDVTSLQLSSAQKGVDKPQHSRQGHTEQQPPRAPIRKFEAENNLNDMGDFGVFTDEEDRYRPRDRR